jgi:hypothetical protein
MTFTFRRVQHGSWGWTKLKRTIRVRADSEAEALAIIRRRKDALTALRNGDHASWSLERAEAPQ